MPGFLLHQGAEVTCAHGGQATDPTPDPRVRVSGMMVALFGVPWVIAGCTVPPPPAGNGPDVSAVWLTCAMRVRSMGIPVLLRDSRANCLATGSPAIIVATQMRVKGI